jgi:hypothetical protein
VTEDYWLPLYLSVFPMSKSHKDFKSGEWLCHNSFWLTTRSPKTSANPFRDLLIVRVVALFCTKFRYAFVLPSVNEWNFILHIVQNSFNKKSPHYPRSINFAHTPTLRFSQIVSRHFMNTVSIFYGPVSVVLNVCVNHAWAIQGVTVGFSGRSRQPAYLRF